MMPRALTVLCLLPLLAFAQWEMDFDENFAAAAHFTAKSYVQDGLVFMLDGIENAGWGVHSGSTNKWKELISGAAVAISAYQGYEWERYGFRSDNNRQYMYHPVTVNSTSNGTMEVCYSQADYSKSVTSGNFGAFSMYPLPVGSYGSWGIAYYTGTQGKKWSFSRVNPWDYNIAAGLIDEGVFVQTMTASSVANNKIGYVYKNGVVVKSGLDFNNVDPIVNHNTHFMRSNNDENLAAYYHSFRIYNRPLSPAEVAHNYAVDKARFGL
ncbi:MAG: hypothetical protein BWX80_04035 [Candidatus Hydrogenedentes bacterium ADurb.Bin101]|nr:MAG: hypothetical protein BWX80_04035 [Candidatus Hydrogenedentes bacterium ADurb.Bin101]